MFWVKLFSVKGQVYSLHIIFTSKRVLQVHGFNHLQIYTVYIYIYYILRFVVEWWFPFLWALKPQVDHGGQQKCWRTAGKSAGVPLAFCERPVVSLCLETLLIARRKQLEKWQIFTISMVVCFSFIILLYINGDLLVYRFWDDYTSFCCFHP